MTRYEALMRNADRFTELAITDTDVDIKLFHANVASGYREKALSLSIEEGGQLI